MNRHISTSTGLVILALVLFAAGIAVWNYIPRDEIPSGQNDSEIDNEEKGGLTEQAGTSNIYRSEEYGYQVNLPAG